MHTNIHYITYILHTLQYIILHYITLHYITLHSELSGKRRDNCSIFCILLFLFVISYEKQTLYLDRQNLAPPLRTYRPVWQPVIVPAEATSSHSSSSSIYILLAQVNYWSVDLRLETLHLKCQYWVKMGRGDCCDQPGM